MQDKNSRQIFSTALLSLIFYPPIIVFVAPASLGYYLINKGFNKKTLFAILAFIIVAIIAFVVISVNMKGGFLQKIHSLIFRDNLEPGIPLFKIENILPIWILIFSIIGLYTIIQRKILHLSYPIIVGLIFWIIYTKTQTVFIIDYPRIVVITAILLSIISAYGLDLVLNKLKKINEKWPVYFLIIIFAIFSALYTQRDNWQKLQLIIKDGEKYIRVNPAPPANQYLKDENIEIFSRFKEKIFLSPAWKGLSIGASTGNFPLESKSATITNRIFGYNDFIKLNCTEKEKIIKRYKINYIYSENISCKVIKEVTRSKEGLTLYSTSIENQK